MSGDNIWVRNEEYNATKTRDEKARRERAIIDAKRKQVKDRMHEVETLLANNSTLDRNELSFKLERAEENMLNSMNDLSDEVRLELGRQNIAFRKQIDEVRSSVDSVTEHIDQVNQRLDNTISDFNRRFNAFSSGLRNQQVRANYYLEQLRISLNNINLLHPDKLTPGEAEDLSQIIVNAQDDIDKEAFQAAISLCQGKIPTAINLQSRLLNLNEEYHSLMQRIKDLAVEINERIEKLLNVSDNKCPMERDKISFEFDGRIDFWSSGLLTEISDKFQNICAAVNNEYKMEMNIEELRRCVLELEQYERHLNGCVEIAHNEFYEYYRLFLLASRIYDVVIADDAWYILNDFSGFSNNDERQPYHMLFEDGSGNTASIVVFQSRELRPGKGKKNVFGETHFTVHINSDNSDNVLCEMIRSSLLQDLKDAGIDIGDNERMHNAADISISDFIEINTVTAQSIKDNRIMAEVENRKIQL